MSRWHQRVTNESWAAGKSRAASAVTELSFIKILASAVLHCGTALVCFQPQSFAAGHSPEPRARQRGARGLQKKALESRFIEDQGVRPMGTKGSVGVAGLAFATLNCNGSATHS